MRYVDRLSAQFPSRVRQQRLGQINVVSVVPSSEEDEKGMKEEADPFYFASVPTLDFSDIVRWIKKHYYYTMAEAMSLGFLVC